MIADVLSSLWQDPGIQRTYEQRSRFQLIDSAAYFFNNLNRLSDESYLPSEEDMLRARARTSGITETTFVVNCYTYRIVDVGGQRNERKKWMHCFEGVTAVIFVAALSEYDQVLYENENVNRMVEALNLFDKICNWHWFYSTAMILFLNKSDLFREKIKKVPLTVCWPDYKLGNEFEPAVQFIKEEFEALNHAADSPNKSAHKKIYTHITCATDRTTMQRVCDTVMDIVINQAMLDAGFY